MAIKQNLGFLILCIVLGLPALMVLTAALVPDYIIRAQTILKKRPRRSFLVGLVNAAFFVALAFVLVSPNIEALNIIGGFIGVIVLPLFIVVGLLIAAACIGERIGLICSKRQSTLLRQLLIGTVVVIPALIVPIFGWLVVLIILLIGLGAGILTLFQRSEETKKITESSVEEVQPAE